MLSESPNNISVGNVVVEGIVIKVEDLSIGAVGFYIQANHFRRLTSSVELFHQLNSAVQVHRRNIVDIPDESRVDGLRYLLLIVLKRVVVQRPRLGKRIVPFLGTNLLVQFRTAFTYALAVKITVADAREENQVKLIQVGKLVCVQKGIPCGLSFRKIFLVAYEILGSVSLLNVIDWRCVAGLIETPAE